MAFDVSLSKRGDMAVVTLSGDLDDVGASLFQDKVAEAAGGTFGTLVLEMSNLTSLSSAGLRGLAFCREKMPDEVEIVVVSPSAEVRAAIEDVEFQQSVTISDKLPQ
ncbi:MAG TPA: STAS domain-containing protein [Pseudonocardiaceae bacterium]|nr:STAS domain-containing protein [Pseudonocardiaceae bacterium]